nr:retrovirus-related Pol polyprotein from transposon TNT 1-94 [Tanacetum cinerariifolium]
MSIKPRRSKRKVPSKLVNSVSNLNNTKNSNADLEEYAESDEIKNYDKEMKVNNDVWDQRNVSGNVKEEVEIEKERNSKKMNVSDSSNVSTSVNDSSVNNSTYNMIREHESSDTNMIRRMFGKNLIRCGLRDVLPHFNGVFLFKFSKDEGLQFVLENRPWLINGKPLLFQKWHQRLSHLNFDTINDLTRNDLVAGLPKFKYHKEHLCPSCEQGKSKRASHPPKPVPNSRQRLHLLHMDLCEPMRIASINGKRYILVIVNDYSRYTWVHFLRSKDEAPEVIIKFLKRITNQVLKDYFDTVGISHQMSSVRTPQQNGVVERRNRTLVEAARTMLIFSRASLFLWAEAIATACFTQNRSIIHCRFNKTPYELINGKKPDISFLHVFGALCYPKNDREDIGKLGAKGDIGFFIGYSADSCTYRIYN